MYRLNKNELVEVRDPEPARFERSFASKIKESLEIEIISMNSEEMEFHMKGIEAPIMNALRRTLLSDVPSMAFDHFNVINNTSCIPDEILCHRLALIPLRADFRLFEGRRESDSEIENASSSLKFSLEVKCEAKGDGRVLFGSVYSGDLKWNPLGDQQEYLKLEDVGPVSKEILLLKMVPGQHVKINMVAVKGTGRDHAKFSPVSLAAYRLLPTIKLKKPVKGDLARRLQKCFTPGVIGLTESDQPSEVEAFVDDVLKDTCSREVFLYPDLSDLVEIGRVKNHCIFRIESTGALKPNELFAEALKLLIKRCDEIREDIDFEKKPKDV